MSRSSIVTWVALAGLLLTYPSNALAVHLGTLSRAKKVQTPNLVASRIPDSADFAVRTLLSAADPFSIEDFMLRPSRGDGKLPRRQRSGAIPLGATCDG